MAGLVALGVIFVWAVVAAVLHIYLTPYLIVKRRWDEFGTPMIAAFWPVSWAVVLFMALPLEFISERYDRRLKKMREAVQREKDRERFAAQDKKLAEDRALDEDKIKLLPYRTPPQSPMFCRGCGAFEESWNLSPDQKLIGKSNKITESDVPVIPVPRQVTYQD